MQLDPTRWLVTLAGFSYDWMITREWKSIFLALVPAVVLGAGGGVIWYGANQDKRNLAQWYIELGDEEIADWEQSWAPQAAGDQSGDLEVDLGDNSAAPLELTGPDSLDDTKQVSRFAEVLFRRVQQLEPSNRSQFVIGATLAQRGATEQAKNMLRTIAPDDKTGYAPAHAFLTLIYLQEVGERSNPELASLIKHHSGMAARWERAPEQVLLAGSQVHWLTNDTASALKMMQQAAERNPMLYTDVARMANRADNRLLYNLARERAEKHLSQELDEDSKNEQARIRYAELQLAERGGLEKAEKLIKDGLDLDRESKQLARAMSEIYRLRFLDSLKKQGERYVANMGLLDIAMQYDPTNPRVPEEVAKLARAGGIEANDELIKQLQRFLAEGRATVMTHAWLAEAYLTRNNYAKAIPHLEQVVLRSPTAAKYLNNLAFVLAELEPDRMEEALEYATRAASITRRTKTPNPDFFDTLGTVNLKLGKYPEAIAAYEMAIQVAPIRKDFHERAAEAYRLGGNEEMAENHMAVIERIKQAEAQAAADAAEKAKLEAATQIGNDQQNQPGVKESSAADGEQEENATEDAAAEESAAGQTVDE